MQKLVPALILAAVSAFAINVQAAADPGTAPGTSESAPMKASEPMKPVKKHASKKHVAKKHAAKKHVKKTDSDQK